MFRSSLRRTCAVFASALSVAGSALAVPDNGYPLLDQATIRAPFEAACEGQHDSVPLPVDPRTLVVEGVNTNPDAAIQFNAFWVDLHAPEAPFLSGMLPPRPQNCGEYRAAVERGRHNLTRKTYFQPFITSVAYYNLYKVWGYPWRPSDFDEQVQKRYGYYAAPWNNPYPYPWEDPNKTNGGSGQLPLGMVQDRDDNGRWTGLISVTCSGCHDSRLGSEQEATFAWGRSADSNDAGLIQSDFFRANVVTVPLQLAPIPWSTGRGTTDAIGIVDLLPALFDVETMQLYPSLLEYFPSHAGGMSKAPHWYHRAWKPRQFWDGALTSDNVRSELAFAMANIMKTGQQRRAVYPEFEDNNLFMMSLSPKPYPGAIDIALAEQGAVLFHERDLWAEGANADIPRAPGNGSCASCHGVYSPRYAHDTNFLPDPRLKGVAGVITPTETIGTDPARVGLMEDERKRRAWDTSWLAYNELSPDHDGFHDDFITSELRRIPRAAYDRGQGPIFSPEGPNTWIDPFGYVASPLYGVWQNAPFFHNGSVPDVWSVLQPEENRPDVWQRPYSEPGIFGKNRGYDFSFASYDMNRLGWKYEEQACSNWASLFSPFLPCTQNMATIDILFANIANKAAEFNSLAYQSPPPVTDQQIKSRMIFNTHLYGNGNQGHNFVKSLTDAERWALIEYMKTL
ncbi:hypothetical protein [Parahaliea mediterranea]|uniref:rubber dioxygenase RoxA n=1 Tax=Parahaliea mediterranea TaxID=651086 RepID=UPI0019D48EA9|nr:hypothetical protein [Parahaliea mediterranea]